MNTFERRRKLNHAVTDIAYTLAHLGDLQRTLNSLAGAYPSSSGGLTGGASTILHCFEHEEDNCPCGGNVPIPTAADPTGNAAGHADPASKALAELDGLVHSIVDRCADLQRLTATWTTTTRLLPGVEGDRGCEVVARITNPATKRSHYERADHYTDVKGNLAQKMHLSRWAYMHVLKTGVIPNDDETRDHIAGKRIRCPHQAAKKASA